MPLPLRLIIPTVRLPDLLSKSCRIVAICLSILQLNAAGSPDQECRSDITNVGLVKQSVFLFYQCNLDVYLPLVTQGCLIIVGKTQIKV
jgi:hypothetical protein